MGAKRQKKWITSILMGFPKGKVKTNAERDCRVADFFKVDICPGDLESFVVSKEA